MLKRTILGAVCAAAVLITGVAQAQENATLTLTSGEKVTGQLIDLGGVGFTVRVNGQDRQIPQNDVAVIDFTGNTMSDADWAKFTGTSQIVLRNGQTIDGQLYDIGGTAPLKLTVRTSSGERDLSSSDVARIILTRPSNAVPTTGQATGAAAAPGTTNTFTVQANQPWTSTGMMVVKGRALNVSTTGQVQLSPESSDLANPDGAVNGRFAARAPLPGTKAGALIGRVGNGQPFVIGAQSTITPPATGILFLGVNDDGFNDNQGAFQVTITRQGAVPRR